MVLGKGVRDELQRAMGEFGGEWEEVKLDE